VSNKRIVVNDLLQSGYTYTLSEPSGKNFHPNFRPGLTPNEMLEPGVFGGKYMTDCLNVFPAEDSRFKHLLRRQLGPKISVEVSAHWLCTEIDVT